MTASKRGGPNRGQGRKPLSDSEPTVTICIRMPESLRDKLERIAGEKGKGQWVRVQVRRAREPSD